MIRLSFRVNKEDLVRARKQARHRGLTVSGYIRYLVEKDGQLIRMEQILVRIERIVGFLFESITALNDLGLNRRLQEISYLARRINLLGNHLTIAILKDANNILTEIERKMNEPSKEREIINS